MLKKLKNLAWGAVVAVDVPNITIPTNTTFDPKTALVNFINWALFFIGAIALIFVVYGGILFITSGGDSEKTSKARNTLLYAVIGIVVVVLAYAIVNWAANSFGQGTIKQGI